MDDDSMRAWYAGRFMFADIAFKAAMTTLSPTTLQRSILVEGCGTDSDCFGGALAFETGLDSITAAAASNGFALQLTPFSTCEVDFTMRKMHRPRLPCNCCRFVDVMDIFVDDNAADMINQTPEFSDKLSLARTLQRSWTGRCERHLSHCPIATTACCKLTGWPCQD